MRHPTDATNSLPRTRAGGFRTFRDGRGQAQRGRGAGAAQAPRRAWAWGAAQAQPGASSGDNSGAAKLQAEFQARLTGVWLAKFDWKLDQALGQSLIELQIKLILKNNARMEASVFQVKVGDKVIARDCSESEAVAIATGICREMNEGKRAGEQVRVQQIRVR